MNQSIEIPLSKKKIVLLLIGAIAFVFGGIWIAANPELFVPNIFTITKPEIIRIVGIVGIIFFGAAGIYILKKLVDKKVGLIIDANGITDNSNASSIGRIEWDDIAAIRTEQIISTKFLLIDLVDPEKYIGKAKNKIQASLMKSNMNMYQTPISITATTLKYDFAALEKLIQTEFKRNQKDR